MKNLFASRSRLPFWKKMFFSFLSLVVVSMLLLASVRLLTFERSTDRLCNEFFGTLLRQSNYSITYVNDLAQRLVSTLTYNYDVVSFLGMKSRNNQQTVDAQRAVNDLVRPLSYLDSVYLYNKGLDLVMCTKTGSQSTLDDFYDQTIADQLRRIDQGEPVDFLPSVHDATYYKVPVSIYSYIVPTYAADGSLVSAVVINVSTDVLLQSLLGINSEDDSLFLFVTDSEGTPLVTPNFSNGEIMPELQTLSARAVDSGSSAGSFSHTIGGERCLISYTNENSNGWYVFGMTTYSNLIGDVALSAFWSLLFFFVLLGICSFAVLRLSRRLNMPIEAITRIARGDSSVQTEGAVQQTEEFHSIAAAFSNIREQNSELARYKSATQEMVRAQFLEKLFCGKSSLSQSAVRQQLDSFGCSDLADSPLCMCLLCIDDYPRFSQENNPRERHALRFALINLSLEMMREHFRCEMVPHDDDKFILLLRLPAKSDPSHTAVLEQTLQQIRDFSASRLELSFTSAYSSVFTGLEHLPQVYENLEELLLLRMQHGYGCIFNPHMAEDCLLEDLNISAAAENILVNAVASCNADQAHNQFAAIAQELFRYAYSDIAPYLIHLAYRILSAAKESAFGAKTQVSEEFRNLLAQLTRCELREDFEQCFTQYIDTVIALVQAQKQLPENQNTNILIQRILKIIESDYDQNGLCLSSIADELGLSAHYVGQVFRSEQKISVAKYILDLRIEKIAEQLRETDRPFAQILESVGLAADQKNYIYTCFKKRFGVTVKNYRMQAAENRTSSTV